LRVNKDMPIPSKRKNEKKSDFLSRCMGDETMNKEFPDQKQRYAVCNTKWAKKKEKASVTASVGEEEIIVE
jgi:hypothetical protein